MSCNAHTLKRDLKHFALAGYRVHEIVALDLFPQTTHVECMALLSQTDTCGNTSAHTDTYRPPS